MWGSELEAEARPASLSTTAGQIPSWRLDKVTSTAEPTLHETDSWIKCAGSVEIANVG